MTLTQKETSLLNDLKSQEQLCIEKYRKYSELACDTALKNIFTTLGTNEQKHLDTITEMLAGKEVTMPAATPSAKDSVTACTPSSCPENAKQNDAYLAKDALAMEKHVSATYNTATFEFSCPTLRDTLAHIQKEEQNHGEQLYSYLSCNNMYS